MTPAESGQMVGDLGKPGGKKLLFSPSSKKIVISKTELVYGVSSSTETF